MALRDSNSIQGTHIGWTVVAVVMIYSNCSITLKSQIIWRPHAAGLDPATILKGRLQWCHATWTAVHAAQGKAGAKRGSNPPRKSVSLHSQRSLCPGEHRGQGDRRHKRWDQGVLVLSIPYIDWASIASSPCSYAESHWFWPKRLPCDSRFAGASSVYLHP